MVHRKLLATTLLLTPALATAQLPASVDLGDLTGIEHGLFSGGVDDARVGLRLSPAGDVNGDGFQDLLASSQSFVTWGKEGGVYLVFGGPGVLSEMATDLSLLNGVDGASANGQAVLAHLGWGASTLGDFNADGYDDVSFGSFLPSAGAGGAYVLFGGPDVGADGSIDLNGFDGSTGFIAEGIQPGDFAGISVTGIGDVNQDGFRDILIGASRVGDFDAFIDKKGTAQIVGGDLDGDGDDDLVAVYGSPPGITSWFNDGAGNFSIAQSLTIPDLQPWFAKLADMDGDGDLDLLYSGTWTQADMELRVVFNPGNGDLSGLPSTYPLSSCWAPFELEDVDGDLDLDVVLGSFDGPGCNGGSGKNLEVFINDGAGTLTPLPPLSLAGKPIRLDLGDIDGDGDSDLLIKFDGLTSYELLTNDGSGVFSTFLPLDPGANSSSLQLADVDGDSDADIFGWVSKELWVYRNDGTGKFGAPEVEASSGARNATAVDLNGDGHPDLIGLDQEHVQVALNRGDGTFKSGMKYDAGTFNVVFALLDINGNGLPGVASYESNDGEIRMLPNRGAGLLDGRFRGDAYVVFGGPGVGASGTFPLAALNGSNGFKIEGPNGGSAFGADATALADINGDGIPDFAVAATGAHIGTGQGGGVLVVFGGSGIGASGKMTWNDMDGTVGFVVPGDEPRGFIGRSLSSGDVNADGLADLVIGADFRDAGGLEDAGKVFVILGRTGIGSGGGFDLSLIDGNNGHVLEGFQVDGSVGERVHSGGDFNGDGADDLLLGAPDALGSDGQAFLVYGGQTLAGLQTLVLNTLDGNNGSAFVSAGTDDTTGWGVGFIGDLDHDGADDIAIGAPSNDQAGTNEGMIFVFPGPAADCTDPVGINYCVAAPNSRGVGARIAAQGSPVVADGCLRLWGLDLPLNTIGYFLASQDKGFVTNPGGSQGNLCLSKRIARFATQFQNSGPGGNFTIQVDLSSIPMTPPHTVVAGETWNFQAWFRDKNPGPTSNFTDGIEIVFN